MELVVLADTHLRAGLEGLPAAVVEAARRADAVLHAGDVVSAAALAELQALGPTFAVLGNNDHQLVGQLPEHQLLDLAGVKVALVHDSGAAAGRAGRLRRRFPQAQLVVFGHSHDPVDEVGLEGQRLFNPGSPTQRRRQPHPTYGRLRLRAGKVERREILIAR